MQTTTSVQQPCSNPTRTESNAVGVQPLRSSKLSLSKPRMRTHQDAPEKPLAPLHGGGRGLESPRLHSRIVAISRKRSMFERWSGRFPALDTNARVYCPPSPGPTILQQQYKSSPGSSRRSNAVSAFVWACP